MGNICRINSADWDDVNENHEVSSSLLNIALSKGVTMNRSKEDS